jgi:lysophospholipase L1-like esterase
VPATADVVIVEAGTNDIWPIALPKLYHTDPATELATREAAYDAVIAGVRAHAPHAKIVVVTIRDFGRGSTDQVHVMATNAVHAFDQRERRDAAMVGGAVVDLETPTQWYDPTDWPDDVHPTPLEAVTLAAAVARVIRTY